MSEEEVKTKSIEQYLEDLEKGIATFDTKFEPVNAQFMEVTKRIDALETKMNTPEAGTAPAEKDVMVEWEKAYDNYFLTGKEYDQEYYFKQVKDFHPDYAKLYETDVLPRGGYFMPVTRTARIIERILLMDPFRAAANVISLSVGDTLEMMAETGAVLAGWTSERGTRAVTLGETFNPIRITAHPMYACPQITQKMARQASFDIEAWHMRRVADYMAYLEGVAFIAGTGSGQPEGISTRATALLTTRSVDSGSTTLLPDFDPIIECQDMLDQRYQANAVWMMNRGTKTLLRKMQDGMGHYILEESVQAGQPDMLFGRPIIYMTSMTTHAAGAATFTQHDVPIIYGDMNACYQIVDIPGMISIRDEITNKLTGVIDLYVQRMGTGGMVVDDSAFTCVQIDT